MLRNKLRIATAIVIALALMAAAVSTADASRKHHQSPAEAHRQLCEDLKLIMTTNQEAAKEAWEAGDSAAVREYDDTASRAYDDARHLGCGWASRATAPDGHAFGEAPPPVGVFG